ncbi:MAG TPA: hypothetical protein PKA98_19100, partial [Acidimicrobiales bacterium]|nr:hypothetical protein [Acidimicrobiales bacterium]
MSAPKRLLASAVAVAAVAVVAVVAGVPAPAGAAPGQGAEPDGVDRVLLISVPTLSWEELEEFADEAP